MQHLNVGVHRGEEQVPAQRLERKHGGRRGRGMRGRWEGGFSPFDEVKRQADQQGHKQQRSHDKQGDFPALEGS